MHTKQTKGFVVTTMPKDCRDHEERMEYVYNKITPPPIKSNKGVTPRSYHAKTDAEKE